MIKALTKDVQVAVALAKRMVYLAWQKAKVGGIGLLQDRGPAQTEEQVWEAATGRHDYDGMGGPAVNGVNADYVMGRMMKLYLTWDDTGVSEYVDRPYRADYQSFAHAYPNFEALARAAGATEVVAG